MFDLFVSLFVFVIWRDVNLATPRESIHTSDKKKKTLGKKNQNNISHKKTGGGREKYDGVLEVEGVENKRGSFEMHRTQ